MFEFFLLDNLFLADSNKIKSLNGKVFAGLSKLIKVDLDHNECVNNIFGENEIATIAQNIPKACSFDEIDQQRNNQVQNQGSALMLITVMLVTFNKIMCY
jgi:hypothetical protein